MIFTPVAVTSYLWGLISWTTSAVTTTAVTTAGVSGAAGGIGIGAITGCWAEEIEKYTDYKTEEECKN